MKRSFISKLSIKGAQDLLDELKAKLSADEDLWNGEPWRAEIGYEDDEDENSIYNLIMLISLLNDYEEEDTFGPTGWEKRYDF